jgi:hypothetical protein
MAAVVVEWVKLSNSPGYDGGQQNIIKTVHGSRSALSVTGTATSAGSRPVAPSVDGPLYARVTAVTGNSIAEFGADPTATQTNGLLVIEGGVELIPVLAGDKLSFIELA